MRFTVALALSVPAIIVACSSGDNNVDGGSDATVDSPSADSTVDAASDTGKDSTADSGSDATNDSASDAASDASDGGVADAQADGGDAGDGGLDDAGCGTKIGYGVSSVTSCATGVSYSCGTDNYDIECDCPGAFCGCKKNDGGLSFLTNYTGCPKCTVSPNFALLAAGCGIPY
jgi:hypothetical protein